MLLQTVPPLMLLHKPVNCITTRCVRTATNKLKCPIFCTCVSFFFCLSILLLRKIYLPLENRVSQLIIWPVAAVAQWKVFQPKFLKL